MMANFDRELTHTHTSIKCCDGLVTVSDIPNLLCSYYLGKATSDKFIKKF